MSEQGVTLAAPDSHPSTGPAGLPGCNSKEEVFTGAAGVAGRNSKEEVFKCNGTRYIFFSFQHSATGFRRRRPRESGGDILPQDRVQHLPTPGHGRPFPPPPFTSEGRRRRRRGSLHFCPAPYRQCGSDNKIGSLMPAGRPG